MSNLSIWTGVLSCGVYLDISVKYGNYTVTSSKFTMKHRSWCNEIKVSKSTTKFSLLVKKFIWKYYIVQKQNVSLFHEIWHLENTVLQLKVKSWFIKTMFHWIRIKKVKLDTRIFSNFSPFFAIKLIGWKNVKLQKCVTCSNLILVASVNF